MEVTYRTVLGVKLFTATPTDPDGWLTRLKEEDPDYLNYQAGKRVSGRLPSLAAWYEITNEQHEYNVLQQLKAIEEEEAKYEIVDDGEYGE